MGDVIYVGACSGILSAIDRMTGTPLWLYDVAADGDAREFHGNPVTAKDRVFIPTDGGKIGHIYAFDRVTGDVAWKYAHRGSGNSGFTSDLLLDGDHIIGVTVDERVVALDAASGAEVWSFPIEGKRRRVGISAALKNGMVIFGSSNGTVYAIDAKRGTQVWKRQLDAATSTAIAVEPDAVVVGTEGSKMYRLRTADGAVLASLQLGAVPQDTPATSDRGIYVITEKQVMLVDPALRKILWHAESTAKWTSPRPRLWRGWVVVGDSQGNVVALDQRTGATVWSDKVHDRPVRGIGSDDTTLYVGTIDGHVIALRP